MNILNRNRLIKVPILLAGLYVLSAGADSIERINPDNLRAPVYGGWSQVVISTGKKTVHLAGMTAKNVDGVVVGGVKDMKAQVRATLEHIRIGLAAAGAKPEDVVRMNVYTLDIDGYIKEGYQQVTDFYNGKPPAATLVGVHRLADREYLVEIEVTAVLD